MNNKEGYLKITQALQLKNVVLFFLIIDDVNDFYQLQKEISYYKF